MKKPIAILLTDTHKKEQNLDLIENIFDQALNLAKSLSVKNVMHLGDFFNNREKQSLECLIMMKDILSKFKKNDILLHGIGGNHDKSNLLSERSYISIFKGEKNFSLYEKESFQIIDDVCFCFLPYFKEGEEYLKRLLNLIEATEHIKLPKVLLTHISINGVRNNDGSLVDKDIKADYFSYFDVTFSGHYHNKSRIKDTNIWYIGSAYQANFGEDERKGFTILYDDLSIKQHQSIFPKYIHHKVNIEDKDQINDILKQYSSSTDNIRVTLTGSKDELHSFQKSSLIAAKIDVKFEDISEIISLDVNNLSNETIVFDKKDLLQHWLKYSSAQKLTSEEKGEGLKLLKQL